MNHATAFPPTRVIIVSSDLVEAELLVVIGSYPLGRIDCAFLQCRIQIAARDLLRHCPEPLQDKPGEPSDPHLQSLEVGRIGDLLAEPTAHLRTGIPRRNRIDIELL